MLIQTDMHRASLIAVLLASGVSLAACSRHRVKLAAEGTGDISNPSAPRGAPDEALSALCGKGETSSKNLKRQPYLQQVTPTSVRILFTATGDEPVTVDVFDSSGESISTEVAAHENGSADEPLVVTIQGLAPETSYCYRVQGMTTGAGFRTAPDATAQAPTRFAAFGDSGNGGDNQRAVYGQIETVPYEFVLHLGDLAYEKGEPWELESHYFSVYRRMERSFAVFPVIGNHDNSTNQAAAFLRGFDLPDNSIPAQKERFYSFDWGHVHFVALDTERITEAQASWMDEDLQKNTLPWVVVYGHRPPYSSGSHGSNLSFRHTFGPIIQKHHVPLVLSGHEHDYERTKPIDGTVYVVSGGGGRDTRSVGWSSFTAYAEDVLHFVFVEVDANTLTLHAIDGVGREFDSVRLDHS
jgi:acid phosphatase type 7